MQLATNFDWRGKRSLLGPSENKRQNRSPAHTGPQRVIFVLSTGRTGTKSLAQGLDSPAVKSLHQPPFSRMLTIASNCCLHGWLTYAVLRRCVLRIRGKQIRSCHRPVYCQVFSLDHLPAKIISENFDNVSVLHLVRDPRTFVVSYLNWMHGRWKSYVANKLLPAWHPSGYWTGEKSWEEWCRMDEFQRVCWHWTYKNRLLEHFFNHSGVRYRRVRFEDLFLGARSEGILREVIDFLGVPFQKRFLRVLEKPQNTSRKTYFPRYPDWPPRSKEQLLNICAEEMQRYHYIGRPVN